VTIVSADAEYVKRDSDNPCSRSVFADHAQREKGEGRKGPCVKGLTLVEPRAPKNFNLAPLECNCVSSELQPYRLLVTMIAYICYNIMDW